MQPSDFNKYLKDTANDPESLWLLFASVVFFPLVLAWVVWKLFNKGADAFLAQALHNTKLKHFQDARIETLKAQGPTPDAFTFRQPFRHFNPAAAFAADGTWTGTAAGSGAVESLVVAMGNRQGRVWPSTASSMRPAS